MMILEPGALATVQDLGRPGYASLGVPRSGAFDRAALRLGNRLVGNEAEAAAIEIVLGGLVFRAEAAMTVALTGAPCASRLGWGAAVSLPAGTTVRIGIPSSGLRTYLAVRGGIAIDPVLGSRSTDVLSALGPAPLRAGDRLPVGRATGLVDGAVAAPASTGPAAFGVTLGPRDDWFTESAVRAFLEFTWTVRADADRIGVRLDGPPLRRRIDTELPSEPVLPGALQVPSDGRPILFGPDAPVTGGYPVIAVLNERDLDRAAQLRPGDPVRFRLA